MPLFLSIIIHPCFHYAIVARAPRRDGELAGALDEIYTLGADLDLYCINFGQCTQLRLCLSREQPDFQSSYNRRIRDIWASNYPEKFKPVWLLIVSSSHDFLTFNFIMLLLDDITLAQQWLWFRRHLLYIIVHAEFWAGPWSETMSLTNGTDEQCCYLTLLRIYYLLLYNCKPCIVWLAI